ncbi:alpha-glucosidase C-terminal domain-containing protein [Gillisia sp. M10.2A]|uniref:Alpha-glucosidase C-terminal domain-containing protein n=1 Tax=Gillisia lutea TaxID=2909668 RepID=A0ABS9EL43_9FLAO|nr:alpha-amylase family glycosyl hydrolase [Gillisia lutea]MCF4102569.1 alpha-glucosidase C-terminal domain-containing protein [Gillisia lutea]
MNKIALTFAAVALMASCKENKQEEKTEEVQEVEVLGPMSEDNMENAVIYEANIRQYSPEGTFNAFTKDIPQLKDLGVKVIWLMPVYPISVKNRKATGGGFVSDIKDEKEREKYLGSYYAISDYTDVNPNFGTKEDFQNLVDTAHENGMFVILDWVANHTGWDHNWIKEHPEYYTQNEKGEIIDPIDPTTGKSWGWTDTADLNYDNKELWEAMTADMKYWVENHNIDGFRSDVAGEVPTEFWEQAVTKIEEVKPIFMLAESEKKDLFHKAFDMGYNWEGHHIMNKIAQGEETAEDWNKYMTKIDSVYQEDDMLMNFITNHDENSWSGTVQERMGDASEAMLALSFTVPGMPLIYSGQEYDMDHRLLFFEKDSIPKTKGKVWPVLVKLGKLKNENPALNGGKEAAAYKPLETSASKKVLAFEREKAGNKVVYIANMSKEPVKFSVNAEGSFEDYMSAEKVELQAGKEMELNAWEYKILINR